MVDIDKNFPRNYILAMYSEETCDQIPDNQKNLYRFKK